MSIDQIIDGILEREGGFVDHPADRGGPTNHGITEKAARQFAYVGPMRDLPLGVARNIYLERYVRQPSFDRVIAISNPIAEELVDTGVNMGPAVAATFLQRVLNVLNLEEQLFPDLIVDGGIGNKTISALQALLARRGQAGEQAVLTAQNCLQGSRYIEIAEHNASQETFIFGWLRTRVLLLRT